MSLSLDSETTQAMSTPSTTHHYTQDIQTTHITIPRIHRTSPIASGDDVVLSLHSETTQRTSTPMHITTPRTQTEYE